MRGRLIAKTANNINVYDRSGHSHLHDQVERKLKMAIQKVHLTKETEEKEFTFNKVIGYQLCIPTTEEDISLGRIYFKNRPGRGGRSRMVKDKDPVETNKLTCILKKVEEGKELFYIIKTAYIGTRSPKEPYDPSISSEEERNAAEDFWSCHALIDERSIVCLN